ncbi:trypsin inhibitor ClTI-1-like [Acipenser oxyrinchus oxyrinchus]|uniref:Trypsin inhibitor ClTI-1-like n=1 Tax=Acipenser oxyrinchus oxyrinchus TaxID=40147 RepID=A0AAD8G1J4_ACIOX|nr:trypsin inhibitor ClTI-1-like [Acipenser oxyrinchus oxyrinchus]
MAFLTRILALVCLTSVVIVMVSGRDPVCDDYKQSVDCPVTFVPVCGSNGNVYANECRLCIENQDRSPSEQVTIKNEGLCIPKTH